jgi:hypothetical protein
MPEVPQKQASEPEIVALVRDLLFGSRISAMAARLGVPMRMVRDSAALTGVPGQRLLVDLNQPGAIEAAAAWKSAGAGREVAGFVSHVDRETIERARARGVDQVLARSGFVEQLPSLILNGGTAKR